MSQTTSQALPSNDDPRSQLAAKLFPREWAKVANLPGASKKRQQLRQRAVTTAKINEMRASGASCATCQSFEKRRHGKEMMCSFHSDFYGDEIATATGLCTDYKAVASQEPQP